MKFMMACGARTIDLRLLSQFPPDLCLSNLSRRVSFPMGSYGAPTMKFTVWHS